VLVPVIEIDEKLKTLVELDVKSNTVVVATKAPSAPVPPNKLEAAILIEPAAFVIVILFPVKQKENQ